MVMICGGGEKFSRNIFSFDSATPSVFAMGLEPVVAAPHPLFKLWGV